MNILDDALLELNEVFFGNLHLPAGSGDRVTFSPGRATATIVDNDAAIIGFVDDYRVTEGVDLSVTVPIRVLAGQLGRSVMVRVFAMDGSAGGILHLGLLYLADKQLSDGRIFCANQN